MIFLFKIAISLYLLATSLYMIIIVYVFSHGHFPSKNIDTYMLLFTILFYLLYSLSIFRTQNNMLKNSLLFASCILSVVLLFNSLVFPIFSLLTLLILLGLGIFKIISSTKLL
jgi:hypothetical protein